MLASATNPTRLLLTPTERPAPKAVAPASSFSLAHAQSETGTARQTASPRVERRAETAASARAADRKDARADSAAEPLRTDAASTRDEPEDARGQDARGQETKAADPHETAKEAAKSDADGQADKSDKEPAPGDKDDGTSSARELSIAAQASAPTTGAPTTGAPTASAPTATSTALLAQPLPAPPGIPAPAAPPTEAGTSTVPAVATAGGTAATATAGGTAATASGTSATVGALEPSGRPEKAQGTSPDLASGFAQALSDATAAVDLAGAPGLVATPATVGTTLHAAAAATATSDARDAAAQPPTPLGDVPIEIGMRALSGSNRFDIRLDPVELGRIDVRLEIDKQHGAVKAHLTVDRPETLALIQRDAGRLEEALSQAGLSTGEGGINVSLRDAQQGGGQGGSPGDGGGSGGGRRSVSGPAAGTDADAGTTAGRPMRVRASGIDIRI